MAAAIFLSYRRDDCDATVAHLDERLRREFGETVYFDRRSAKPGEPFPTDLRDAVEACT